MRQAINRLLGVICYPFGGMEYFKQDQLIEYITSKDKNRASTKKKLYKQFNRDIKAYCQIHSLDEMCLLFDKYYVRHINNSKCKNESDLYQLYFRKLSRMAKAFISQRDGKVVYKYWQNEEDEAFLGGFSNSDKLLLFQALNTRMSIDVIVIQYLLDNGMTEIRHLNNYFGQVTIADLQLDQILESGTAENHLHLGTAVNFFILWESIMQNPKGIEKEAFHKFVERLQEDARMPVIHFFILVEGILRITIGIYLRKKEEDPKSNENFVDYWRKVSRDTQDKMKNQEDTLIYKIIVGTLYGDLLEEIGFETNQKIRDIDSCRGIFIKLWDELVSEIEYYEPNTTIISNIFSNTANIHTSEENIFLFKTMRYLHGEGEKDEQFIKIFFQYLRIKNEIFRLWVQDNNIRGLKYFNDFYHRNGDVVALCKKNLWERIISAQFQDDTLKKIEFRTTLNDKESDCKKWVIEFLRAYEKVVHQKYCHYDEDTQQYIPYKSFPQAGIVYHLIKRYDEELPEKCWREYYANESFDVRRQSYRQIQKQYFKQIDHLKKLRKDYPILSRYLVGLDAASEENNTPIWVFAPVYEKARDSLEEPLYVEEYSGRDIYTQSLRFTFHAGEDFRHILSGLRRIDEVIEHCKFHSGDRIGHGVALGLNPKEWAEKCPMVILPRVEILNNLLWVWWLFSKYPNKMQGVQFYLEQEIFKYAKAIYKNMQGITVTILIEAYRKQFKVFDDVYSDCYRYRDDEEQEKDFNNRVFCEWASQEERLFWTVDKLLAANHCKKYLVDMLEPIYYKVTPQEIEIAQEAQKILKSKVSQSGIIIEVNPSSNAYITEVESLFRNQAFVLNDEEKLKENVMICINTDNPSSCQTNISNELAYIYYGLLAQGKSKEVALRWIDKLRQNGIYASFIKNDSTKEQLLKELEQLVKDLQ